MYKENIFSKQTKKDNTLSKQKSRFFEGTVKLKDLSDPLKSSDQKIYHVLFQNGAKTKLHLHAFDQILIGTASGGFLEIYQPTKTASSGTLSKIQKTNKEFRIRRTKKISIKKGDILRIPQNTLHSHGACKGQREFSHVAINSNQLHKKEPKTVWFDSDFKTKAKKIT